MEYEVRAVVGIETCYASLPLSLIQRLESSSRLNPNHILSLQLRSTSNPSLIWHVAWSGSASSSSAIEVSQQFAECLGLPDRSLVVVRALPSVPKASFVTIEPLTEDDWEVLELNSDAAEAAILSQVRILNESMRFPLWLHGRAVVTFVVVSTEPKNAVVQLVPGTEVAVAPKRRQKSGSYSKDTNMQPSDGSHPFEPVLLRVQDSKKILIHNCNIGDVDVKIDLSTIALMHPDTGKSYLFDPLQVVVLIPRVQLKEKLKADTNEGTLKKKLSSSSRDANGRTSTRDTESRYVIVQILFSENVAKGHLMLSLPLRCYLGASVHSWIYVQRYANHLKKDLPAFLFSPCQFMMLKRNNREPKNNDVETIENDSLSKSVVPQYSEENIGTPDWSIYHKHVSSLPFEVTSKEIEDVANLSDARKGIHGLLHTWFKAQFNAIKSMAGVEPSCLVLGPITFLHIDLGAPGFDEKLQMSSMDFTHRRRGAREPSKEILCSLSSSSEQPNHKTFEAYELSIGPNSKSAYLTSVTENLMIGDALSFESVKEEAFNHQFSSTSCDLNWLSGPASDVTNRLKKLLSPVSGLKFTTNIPLPGHILIYGPSGSGKSLLASAVAKSLEEDEPSVHIVYVPCSTFVSEKVMTIHQKFQRFVSEALDHAPALIILDDLDRIIPSSVDSEGPDESASVALTELVIDIIDEYEEKGMGSCGLAPIAFVACVQTLDSIPQSLRTSGRFDFNIQLPAPASLERMAILKHEILKHFSECSEDILHHVASKADGYDAHDLETLTNRSILVGMSHSVDPDAVFEGTGRQSLLADDFMQAMEEFVPSSMQDVTDSSLSGRPGWEDIGGLVDVKSAIKEMIELPSKFPNVFAKSPLRLRSNVLLYGPPGCGKTHIVGAAAAASSLRFISIKGPELLNKYIGASEQSVRDVFSKAAAAAPCLLFFDEFDSIAPKRGHDNTGVTDRVVNQFLTELDGVEVLNGVFVFAATSRPDLLDAALLRPGRLDRLLFCDFPSLTDRLDILKTLSRKLPLADDVDLTTIAHMTEGFSGADLRALLSDAEEAAIKEIRLSADEDKPKKILLFTNELLQSVASKARPSVSESEKQRLYGIYSQFLSSKKSAASQSRDRKGKRATLA